jgi:hypothetical protein
MRVRGRAAFVACASAVVAACGLGVDGLGPAPGAGPEAGGGDDVTVQGPDAPVFEAGPIESAPPADAAETGPVVDAPGETATMDSPAPPTCPPGVVCNGVCTDATDCHACAGATLLCGATSTCASDCTACPTSPIECFACDATRQNPIATCEAMDTMAYCLDTNYAGAYDGQQGYHCACTTAADCPGDSQVCIAVATGPFACFTCGEAFTDMATCKRGKAPDSVCNQMKAACN